MVTRTNIRRRTRARATPYRLRRRRHRTKRARRVRSTRDGRGRAQSQASGSRHRPGGRRMRPRTSFGAVAFLRGVTLGHSSRQVHQSAPAARLGLRPRDEPVSSTPDRRRTSANSSGLTTASRDHIARAHPPRRRPYKSFPAVPDRRTSRRIRRETALPLRVHRRPSPSQCAMMISDRRTWSARDAGTRTKPARPSKGPPGYLPTASQNLRVSASCS